MKTITDNCDVLVIGGGTAGTIAAIQSAMAGADTILIEMSTQLGGTITNAGVHYPAYFFAGNRQIVGGIGWELVKECVELADGKMPDWANPPANRPSYHVSVKPELYAMLAEEKALASGVRINYQEILTELSWGGESWHATTRGKMLCRKIIAKEVIDYSGDAVGVRLAGGLCEHAKVCQPGTLMFSLTGYDINKINPESVETAYREALESGELEKGDFCFPGQTFINYLKNHGGNLQHIFDADSADSSLQTTADIAGRQRLLKMLRFLRRQPGLEQCTVAFVRGTVGIRESYRIVGETTISEKDYLSGRKYDDSVAYTYYYVDIHHEQGIEYKFLAPGVYPEIPLRALIPKDMKHILVAGKTISSGHAAFSALRVQASCMAMGQAAGAAAALASRLKITPQNVSLKQIRELLLANGAIVPE